MPMQLTKEALSFLENHGELYGAVSDKLGIKPASLVPLISRNGRRLTEFPIISLIGEAMGKEPMELVETKETETVQ